MNPFLEKKLEELKKAEDYECWYLVKQPTEFDSQCYYVSFLQTYQSTYMTTGENFEKVFSSELNKLLAAKPSLKISDNYRALRVAAYFGLIRMTSKKYEDAVITDTFKEITSRCGGNYEETNLYSDVIQRQIEKLFISSPIDEEYKGVRQNFRLYPVMLLYKVLLEIGRSTGKYQISMTEYRYFVATTEKYEDFLETLLYIKLLRDEDETAVNQFEAFRSKFDNRLIQALKQLETLIIDNNSISMNPDKIGEVEKKIFIFEQNPDKFEPDDYLTLLGSTRSLFDPITTTDEKEDDETFDYAKQETDRLSVGANILLYGVPGAGKSWTIEHEYCKDVSHVERLVFHPDYTSSDFIGQILPKVDEDGQVTYEFAPGPFTSILRDAYQNPTVEYVLIIEEVNRGNAPAIFGEVFQLLDRIFEPKEVDGVVYPAGTSEYGITNSNMAQEIYHDEKHKIRIPANLSIIGTMNTSDQNVFTLDTAFQRRWNMRLIENSFDNVRKSLADAKILDTDITWETFCTAINKSIITNKHRMSSAEDKRLGVYFVHENDLAYDSDADPADPTVGLRAEYNGLVQSEESGTLTSAQADRLGKIREALNQNRKFPEKVIKYLWDDAFKFNPNDLFDTDRFDTLEAVIEHFVFSTGSDRLDVFKDAKTLFSL